MNTIIRSTMLAGCRRVAFVHPSPVAIHTTVSRKEIFKLQDEADYKSKVLESKKLVILDFYATWCGPCQRLAPRLETVVGAKGDQIDLAKVDVDEMQDLAAEYNVSTIPSVFAVKDGKVVGNFVGSLDDDQLGSFVDGALGK